MPQYISQLIPIGHKNKVIIREMKNMIYIVFFDAERHSRGYTYINLLKVSETPAYRCADKYPGERFWCLKGSIRELTLNYPDKDVVRTFPGHEIILIKERKKDGMGDVQLVFIPIPLTFSVSVATLRKLKMQIVNYNIKCVAPHIINSNPVINPPYERFCASGKRERQMIGILRGDPKIFTNFDI